MLKSKYSPAELPYHIINPSLPGYGYSAGSTPLDKDWHTTDTARVMNSLMVGLGFGKSGYVAQGGDVGSYVSRMLAAKYESCRAAHREFEVFVSFFKYFPVFSFYILPCVVFDYTFRSLHTSFLSSPRMKYSCFGAEEQARYKPSH